MTDILPYLSIILKYISIIFINKLLTVTYLKNMNMNKTKIKNILKIIITSELLLDAYYFVMINRVEFNHG